MRFNSALMAGAILTPLVNALTSSLQQVTGFTGGPTAAQMYVYIPTTKVANAPIVVAIHYCSGTASAYFSGTSYAQYADTYGYIVVFPNSPSSGGCWDVASTASLTHNGGGDSQTIVNMVKYAISNYGGDANRVYVTGSSSGAMMTNVLAGAYPDVFKAGTLYAGVPDGCFYVAGATAGMATPGWNSACANGQVTKTAQAWGDLARSYYPGYTGSRPKMQLYHGTVDAILLYPNLAETLKQWSNVLGVSFSQNITNSPISGYTKIVYGDGTQLVGISCANVGHTPPVRVTDDLAWFGIPGSGSSSSSSTSKIATTLSSQTTSAASSTVTTPPVSSSTTTAPPASTTTGPSTGGGSAAHWGQCGGTGWTGPTTCASPYTCKYSNAWYSQCL